VPLKMDLEDLSAAILQRISLANLWRVPLMLTAAFCFVLAESVVKTDSGSVVRSVISRVAYRHIHSNRAGAATTL